MELLVQLLVDGLLAAAVAVHTEEQQVLVVSVVAEKEDSLQVLFLLAQ
jgi:hypothetical protein